MSRALRSEVFEDLYRGNLSNLLRMVHKDTTLNMELRGNGVAYLQEKNTYKSWAFNHRDEIWR